MRETLDHMTVWPEAFDESDILDLTPSYFGIAFDQDITGLIRAAKKSLARVRFDTMVGIGMSGSVMVPTLARAMKKNFAIVRKDGESTHSIHDVEGRIGRRWIFVDDFVDTGKSRDNVIDEVTRVAERHRWDTSFCGTYQYDPRHCLTPALWQPFPPLRQLNFANLLRGAAEACSVAPRHPANGGSSRARGKK